ncbi:MAG: sensor histidine kinase [Thermoanaerobaculia bacterium]
MSEDRLRQIAEQVARITAENSALLERVAESERRFRRISRGVLKLQEEERTRISRDLHDGIGQSLTALRIQLELLEQRVAERDPSLSPEAASARELAESCLADVRQLSRVLRPPMLDDLGLGPTLRWLARTLQEKTGIVIDLRLEGEEARADPGVETLVYRLVQEALTNVVKHAGTRSAAVAVTREGRRIRVRVEDGGRGFDAARILSAADESGSGVRGMRDRVHFFDGRFTVRSTPGSGTMVEAEIPLPSAEGGPEA